MPRHVWVPISFICALYLSSSAGQQAQPRRLAPKGQKKVSTLQLTAVADRPEVLAGESIPVTVTAVNTGSAPVAAPDPERTFAFDIVLRSAADPALGYVLNMAGAYAARHSEDSQPALPKPVITLDPGQSASYHVDAASMALAPLKVGKYTVAAGLDLDGYVESPQMPFEIVLPHVLALSSAFSPNSLNQVIAHQEASGHLVIFQRQGHQARPDDGAWFRRAAGPEPNMPVQTSAAIDLSFPDEGIFWYAWLSGDAVSAGVAQAATVFKTVGPQPLGLTHTSLSPQGWQPDANQAYFVALGLNPSDEAVAALIHAEAAGKITVRTVPLGVPGMPSHWAVQYRPETSSVTITGSSERANLSRVWTRSINLETAQPEPLRALSDLNGPAVALALAPLADNASAETVDVLSGPFGNKREMKLVRLPLVGGAPTGEWVLDLPMNTANRLPAAWALGPNRFNNPPVLALLDGRIYSRRAREAGWTVFATGDIDPQFTNILDNGAGMLFAIWVDRALGIQYRPLGKPNQPPPPDTKPKPGNIF